MIAQTQNQESTLQTMLKSIAMAMVATGIGSGNWHRRVRLYTRALTFGVLVSVDRLRRGDPGTASKSPSASSCAN